MSKETSILDKYIVDHGVARLAKYFGFDELCFARYSRGNIRYGSVGGGSNYNDGSFGGDEIISAPLYEQLCTWFEEQNIYIRVWPSLRSDPIWWDWSIECFDSDNNRYSGDEESYRTKREAFDAAFGVAFELLMSFRRELSATEGSITF